MPIIAAGPVRVTKNGNARTLTIPTDIAARVGIELGDRYMVEAVDGVLIYRPVELEGPADPEHEYVPGGPRGYFVGEGSQRYFQLYRGATVPAGPDPSPAPPIDWDF